VDAQASTLQKQRMTQHFNWYASAMVTENPNHSMIGQGFSADRLVIYMEANSNSSQHRHNSP
jgi:hypothetical protein